jgi:2,3-bisphosphoglycerate-independent phosphoglycerate mutase
MQNRLNRPLALIILDGWGDSSLREGNAIAAAHTPFYDEVCRLYPRASLAAAGPSVGLPSNSPGTPEVGHLNLGTGRVVRSNISRLSDAVRSGEFFTNKVLQQAFGRSASKGSAVHLIGLLSDAGLNSSLENLFALLRMAKAENVSEVFVHCILDGRDCLPRTADVYVDALEIKMSEIGIGRIASLCGRFYAMDTAGKWERTARAFTMLVHGEGERASEPKTAIRNSFLRGIAEEFIAPVVLTDSGDKPLAMLKEGDTAIFFNHRADGMRQLVKSLAGSAGRPVDADAALICLTEYDASLGLPVAFPVETQNNFLAQVLANNGIGNCRITESERSAHISYLFNGGSDMDLPGESHAHIASPKRDSFEMAPELSSFKIADRFRQEIAVGGGEVYFINLPASGIVAETGNFHKTVESVQFVDTCLGGILDSLAAANGMAVITSSYGNCCEMQTEGAGAAVPLSIVDQGSFQIRPDGSLQDVAPTILGLLGLEKPPEMSGNDLRII